MFFPLNTEFYVGFLITPLEMISYLFRPISLGLRLCINMIAGHILLKLGSWISWQIMKASGLLFFFQLIPLVILIPLTFLEGFVCVLQGYVFMTLVMMYLGEILNID